MFFVNVGHFGCSWSCSWWRRVSHHQLLKTTRLFPSCYAAIHQHLHCLQVYLFSSGLSIKAPSQQDKAEMHNNAWLIRQQSFYMVCADGAGPSCPPTLVVVVVYCCAKPSDVCQRHCALRNSAQMTLSTSRQQGCRSIGS